MIESAFYINHMTVTARHVINTPNGDVMQLTDNCGQPSCLYQQVSFPDSLVKPARVLVKALTDGCDWLQENSCHSGKHCLCGGAYIYACVTLRLTLSPTANNKIAGLRKLSVLSQLYFQTVDLHGVMESRNARPLIAPIATGFAISLT